MASEFVIKNGYFSQGNSNITGSLTVTGGVTASLQGTSSYALTASYAMNGGGGSSVDTGSLLTTASFNAYTGSASSQFAGTASYTINAATASFLPDTGTYNITASWANNSITASYYAETDPVFVSVSGSFVTTASFNNFTASYTTGSFTGSFTGVLTGTASYANQALSSSYATTASYAAFSLSSSYSATASIALTSLNASDVLIYVKNVTGATINKGTVVRISGATGDNALISTASYEADSQSANTLGILNETIADQSFGYVMTEGKLLGIDTNAFTAGQLLFLGPTGSIIGYTPVPPFHSVRLGQALRIQQNNGSMYVRIDNGYELDELHNVLIISGSDGDLLVASGSNGNGKKLYINSRQLTGSYGLTGSLAASEFIGSLTGTASYAANANLLDGSDSTVFATTGSNVFKGSQIITGSLTITNDLTVIGSSSIQYITSSQLDVSTNIISVNTFSPSLRFGGIAVIDSGSSPIISGSLLFDSQNNQWIFVHRDGGGAAVTSSVLIMGPQTFNDIGNETTITTNRLTKGTGGDLGEHIGDSNITDTGTLVTINSKTEIIGSVNIGTNTTANGTYSHAEGNSTVATGSYTHAEGSQTYASGLAAHAEGFYSTASGNFSHAEGTATVALGNNSHAEGYGTVASGSYQHVSGIYNLHNNDTSLLVIGNGTTDINRSDILRVTTTDVQITGSFNVSGSYASPSGNTISSDVLLQSALLYLSNNC